MLYNMKIFSEKTNYVIEELPESTILLARKKIIVANISTEIVMEKKLILASDTYEYGGLSYEKGSTGIYLAK